jgi:hypothetical protein
VLDKGYKYDLRWNQTLSFDFPSDSSEVEMWKLIVFVILVVGRANAQEDEINEEVCVDLGDGEKVGIEESCTAYWDCYEGYGYYTDCEAGYEFDYNINDCSPAEEVNCAGGGGDPEPDPEPEPEPQPEPTETPRPDTTVTAPNTTPSDPSIPDIECPTNRPGEIIFFPSSNCSEYYICANGLRMRMVCMEGFTWNQEEKQCDYPIYSRCSVSFT